MMPERDRHRRGQHWRISGRRGASLYRSDQHAALIPQQSPERWLPRSSSSLLNTGGSRRFIISGATADCFHHGAVGMLPRDMMPGVGFIWDVDDVGVWADVGLCLYRYFFSHPSTGD